MLLFIGCVYWLRSARWPRLVRGTPPLVVRYVRIIDLARALRQSLERKIVIGKVLIVGQLGLLHPYLPGRSRLARSYGWRDRAYLLCFAFISIIGARVKGYSRKGMRTAVESATFAARRAGVGCRAAHFSKSARSGAPPAISLPTFKANLRYTSRRRSGAPGGNRSEVPPKRSLDGAPGLGSGGGI